jgi:hypothetical protein
MPAEIKVILFTDQVKSTPATAQRTPQEIRLVAREQEELTTEVARLCRGTQLKDTGDGALIEFGSCADAVRFGAILQQRVRARNDAQVNERLRFDLHVGIDFGEVEVLDDGDIRGNAANRAARVSGECPAGEVYFTEKVKDELHSREAEVVAAGVVTLKGVGEVPLYRLVRWLGDLGHTANPFTWRKGITDAEAFFDRDREQRVLRDFLHKRQNGQIVGPRRMGKTSLLLQVQRAATTWQDDISIAYLDLQHPHCFTLAGWLRRVGRELGWDVAPPDMVVFAERVEELLRTGRRLVLCLDEFEELGARPTEFTRDFFLALRSCGQLGLSILTASHSALSTLTDPAHTDSSPFFNSFPLISLGPSAREDAEDFIAIHRPGVPPFAPKERRAIRDFAKGHPLALQVACFHVLEAKAYKESLATALRNAEAEMKQYLPTW